MSKFTSNEKLKSYLKAYDRVKDELYSKMDAPNNWLQWCLERYDCTSSNITNSVSSVVHTKQ